MADDDIKKDADLQRGKDPLENGAVENELDLLKSIKDTLMAQTEMLEGDISSELTSVKDVLTSILDVNKKQLETLSNQLNLDKSEIQEDKIDDLRAEERDREMLELFKDIKTVLGKVEGNTEDSGKRPIFGLLGLGAAATALFSGSLAKGALAVAGIGVGLGLAAAGFLLGAKAVEWTGETLGDINYDHFVDAGKGLSKVAGSLDGNAIKAIAAVFGGAALVTMGSKGVASIAMNPVGIAANMAGVGLGIGGFFAGFMLGAKAVEGVDNLFDGIDYGGLVKTAHGFNDVIAALDGPSLGIIGTLLAVEIFKNSTFTGSKFHLEGSSSAKALFGVGAGISAFFLGLTLGDALVGLTDSNLASMTKASEGLIKVMRPLVDNKDVLLGIGTLVAAGIFGTFKGGFLKSARVVGGIALAGAAIGSFFTGLNVGAIGTWIGDGGDNLAKLMNNVADGLNAFSGTQIKSMLAAGGIFGVVTAIPGGAAVTGLATVGIGLAGAALGAFFTGIGLNDALLGAIGADGSTLNKLMTNTASGLSSFNEIDGVNLIAVGGGLAAIGAGLFGFATGKFFDSAGKAIVSFGEGAVDLVKDLGSVVGLGDGATERTTVIENLAQELRQFSGLGPDLDAAVNAVQNLPDMFGNLKPKDEAEVLRGITFYAGAARMLLNEFDFEAKDRAFSNIERLNEVTKGLDFKATIQLEGIDKVTEELDDLAVLLEKITNNTGIAIQPNLLPISEGDMKSNTPIAISSTTSSRANTQFINFNSSSRVGLSTGGPGE